MQLNWKITRGERVARQKKLFPAVFIIMLMSSVFVVLETSYINSVPWYLPIIVVGVLLIYYLVLPVIPLSSYAYSLKSDGFEIKKNRQTAGFIWNNFSHFYDYTKARSRDTGESEIVGNILYLEKKKVTWGREFVVIKTEPSNTKEVKKLISQYLLEKEYLRKDDWGLKKISFR